MRVEEEEGRGALIEDSCLEAVCACRWWRLGEVAVFFWAAAVHGH